jgi:peptidylprolyl isomerase
LQEGYYLGVLKMQRLLYFFGLLSAMTCSFLYSVEKAEEEAVQEEPLDISKISEAFGHLIGKNVETLGFKVDLAKLIKGLQDEASGVASPMTEMECVQAISSVQEGIFKKQAKENLSKAEDFLAKNEAQKGIVSLEKGRLQYKIEKQGQGASVEEHFSPLIRYTGKFLDGTVFGSSKEDEMISLDETIAGFSKGLLGMKEGEKRTLFIHPELGYGTSGYLPPNSLLTFEIEIVKANNPKIPDSEALSSNIPNNMGGSEIATPVSKSETTVR